MASLKDIAKELNISTTTVSIVLNNKPGVSDKTRILVLETAKKLGYEHKAKSGKNVKKIDLIILSFYEGESEFDNPLLSQVIRGISIRARELSYSLQVSYYSRSDLSASTQLISTDSKGVLLMFSDFGDPDFSILDTLNLPVVVLDKSFFNRSVDTISANHIQGAQLATEHLIYLGHTELCFIQSPVKGSTSFLERLLGYQKSVLSHAETMHCFKNVLYSTSQIDKFAEQIKSLSTMPTAFVCANDGYASQCMKALRHLGYRVPEDASVIGFDNGPLCEAVTPKLTSMNVPKQRIGALAVDRLNDVISGRTDGESVRIEIFADLVIRDSTAEKK